MDFPASCLENVSLWRPQGRDKFPYLFLTSFSLSFSLFLIAGVTTLCMGEVFSLELEFSFEEWRAGTVGGILESAFSAAGLHISISQNGSRCESTRTAMFVFG